MSEIKTYNVARVTFIEGSSNKPYSYRIPEHLTVNEGDIVAVSRNGMRDVSPTLCTVVSVIDALDDAYSQTRTGKRYEQVVAVINTSEMYERRKREERQERLLDLLSAELDVQQSAMTAVPSELLEQYRGKSPLIDSLLDAIIANR